jgi:LmbE family N-acetylglucosaminyl deacetylase
VRGEDHDACWAIAEQIQRDRPQWVVLWGRYSGRFWAYPLFEMYPRRMLVYAGYPDALVARMDEAERRFRVWPERGEVSDCDTDER